MNAANKPIFRSFAVLFLLVSVISACSGPATPGLTPTSSPTTAASSTPKSTQIPTTVKVTSANEKGISLGEPVWIGRGVIIDAEFIPEQENLAIAWANGVSVFDLKSKNELWYRDAPTNLLAFDSKPGGGALATLLADGRLQVYSMSDGTVKEFGEARDDAFLGDIAWSPDGRFLAFQIVSLKSMPIEVLEPDTGELRTVPGSWIKDSTLPNLVWSPDSQTITVARAPENGCPKVISVKDGQTLFSLESNGLCANPLTLAYFTRQSNREVYLAAAGGDHAVELISYPNGSPAGSFDDPDYQASWEDGGLFSDAAGASLVSLGRRLEHVYGMNLPIVIWDTSTGKPAFQFIEETANLKVMRRIAGGFVGNQVFVLYENGEIMTWRGGASGEYSSYAARTVDAVKPWVYRFSGNEERIATEGQYGGIAVWEIASGKLIRRFEAPLVNPALNPDGNQISLFDESKGMQKVLDVDRGKTIWEFPADVLVNGAAFSADGSRLAFNHGGNVQIANLADGKVQTLYAKDPSTTAGKQLTWVSWSPDGNAVAAAFVEADQGWIVLWESDTGSSFVDRFEVEHASGFDTNPSYTRVAFSPSGKLVAIAKNVLRKDSVHEQNVVIYDRENQTEVREIVNFLPIAWMDENTLLALEAQINIRFAQIDPSSGKMVFGSGGDYLYISSSPDGEYFVQLDLRNRKILVKDWLNGRVLARASHQALNLSGVYWSADGRWVASLGSDGSLRIWEVFMN